MTEEPANQRKIIHVDMDAFYASVEQRDNPELRGKPIAVGSPQARGVVATASYEARAFGIHSAMPSVTAMRKCPQLIFVRPRFEVYRSVSAQIREIFAEHTSLIEPLSLDEAYLDVTENHKAIPFATEVARQVRARIREVTGLTSSAGISYNKFLAKVASSRNKPDGQFVITPDQGEAFMASLPIEKFHGVGPATAARMRQHGILSGADLRQWSLEDLSRIFGKSGRYYFDLARGIDHRPVNPERERKSVGAEDTFPADIEAIEDARAMLAPLMDKVWRICGSRELRGRTVTLKIKFANFEQITRSRSRPAPLRSREEMGQVVEELLGAEFPPRMPVRLLGVAMSSFEPEPEAAPAEQLVLEF